MRRILTTIHSLPQAKHAGKMLKIPLYSVLTAPVTGQSIKVFMASSINGFGRAYYGRRDFEADGSFVTTKWLIMAFLPISPAQSIRVKITDSGGPFYKEYEVVEELPICWTQVLYTYAYVYGLIPLALYFSDKFHWRNGTQIIALLLVAATPYLLRFFAKRAS